MSDDIDQYFAQMQIGHQPPGRVFTGTAEGLSDIYAFNIRPNQKIYRYDVEVTRIFLSSEREVTKDITRTGQDDGQMYNFRKICFEAMTIVYNKSRRFGSTQGNEITFVYDNRKNLFTNSPINSPERSYKIASAEFPEEIRGVLSNDSIHVEIQPCQTAQSEIDISDVQQALQKNVSVPPDHTLRMFLELLTTQHFLNARTHTQVGAGKIFNNGVAREMQEPISLHLGIAKGVRIIEGEQQHNVPALVLDVKTCAFMAPVTLDVAYDRLCGKNIRDEFSWQKFNAFYKGVRVQVTYNPSSTFLFGGVTARPLSEFHIDHNGSGRVRLIDYHAQKGHPVQNPNLRAVYKEGRRNEKEPMYPMQYLRVLPFQRIPIEKMTEFLSRELLNANTTRPDQRFAQINEEAKRIGAPAGNCAKFMASFGVKLEGGKNNVNVKVRRPPTIQFGGKTQIPSNGGFDIRESYRYYKPSDRLKNWVVAYPSAVRHNIVQNFIEFLIKQAREKGVNLPPPEFKTVEYDALGNYIETISKQKKQFLTYIDSKRIKSHGILKLKEKQFNILTQHVTSELVEKSGRVSVGNVLAKMHMKIAFQLGLNYMPIYEEIARDKFNISSGHVLVIGLSSSMPPKTTPFERYSLKKKMVENKDKDDGRESEEPMIIGISANYVTEPHSFLGTYFFQPKKQDSIDNNKLKVYTKFVLGKVEKNRPNGGLPPTIVIIRDGVSEGMIPHTVKTEFSAIREACRQFHPFNGFSPKFVFCVVDKSHNKRFFLGKSGQQGGMDNMQPSSVVDTKVVRPDMHEFYMQSHRPLKGTATVPQYVFPINELNATNDELQAFINGLCHSFQIVNLAPSLPTPVIIAKELAKRGRNNYIEMKRTSILPKLIGLDAIDFEKLNDYLAYDKGPFSNTRFNA